MAVMMTPRETWTDKRLDDLNHKVDEGFKEVDARFDDVDARFEAVDARFRRVLRGDRRADRQQRPLAPATVARGLMRVTHAHG